MSARRARQVLALGLAGLVCSPAATYAQDAASAAARAQHSAETNVPAWSERALGAPVARNDFVGTLDADRLARLIARGEALFTAKFTVEDGAGRPMATQAIVPTRARRERPLALQRMAGPDALACASCHNDPLPGGAGDFTVNVFVSEGFESADFDTIDPQFSNERNTNHLMGAGLVELLAREMSRELQAQRRAALAIARQTGAAVTAALSAKGVDFGAITALADGTVDLSGLDGVDDDLVIRPFSQKGVMTSLRQFTVNALNHHHGMQADERFGARWTGSDDFDADGHEREIGEGDVSALVAWQASRPAPGRIVPDDPDWRAAAARGDGVFDTVGCAACHIRALPLDRLAFDDPGPVDAAGTLRVGDVAAGAVYDLGLLAWTGTLERDHTGRVLVPLFGDLKRHKVTDRQVAVFGNELLAQRFVERDVFQTTELWGVATTAPYGHRGDLTTLDAAIRAHGGAARPARDGYIGLDAAARGDLIAFLKTLVIAK